MRNFSSFILTSVILLAVSGCSSLHAKDARLSYPPAAKGSTVEDYFGTKVADPFRWLEDDNAPETKSWVEAQNAVTFKFLEAIPQRAAIKAKTPAAK